MSDPPSWGLAGQDNARFPTNSHLQGNFWSESSRSKDSRQARKGSKQGREDVSAASTAIMSDISRNSSRVDLSADAHSGVDISTDSTTSDSSVAHLDKSDSEAAEQAAFDSEPEIGPSPTSLSTASISTAQEKQQLATPDTNPQKLICKIHKARIEELPAPTEGLVCIYRRTETLEFDEHGEPYFKISQGKISISSLPLEEQNAAYGQVLTKSLSTNARRNKSAATSRRYNEFVQEYYRLHLLRLTTIRSSIRDLTVQHRTSAKREYKYEMSPWPSCGNAPYEHGDNALRIFRTRSKQESEERGILDLLDRCEKSLKRDPDFRPADTRPGLVRTTRWKEGRRGWRGLHPDDLGPHVGEVGCEGPEKRTSWKTRVKAVLKEAFTGCKRKKKSAVERAGLLDHRVRVADRRRLWLEPIRGVWERSGLCDICRLFSGSG